MPSRPISGNPRGTSSILKSEILFLATTLSITALIISTLIYTLYNFWSSLFQSSKTRHFEEITHLKLQKFTYKELKSATNDFNPENAIGKGGSGSVFRGILRDGKSVAVKLLDPSAFLQAEKEFQNELTILGSIKSPHIVSLLGFCVYKNKRILVYEYMPNRSLQELLFCDLNVVGWDRRFQFIQDVARALEFLHNECDPPVIHGDIKPSNVLLDWDFKAKVCDFGLSRVKVDDDEEQFGDEMFSQELDRSQELAWKSQEIFGNVIVETPMSGARTPVLGQGCNVGEVSSALALQASSSSKNGWMNHDLQSLSSMIKSRCIGGVARESDAKSVPSPKGKEVLRIGVLEDELCVNVEHCKDELDLGPSRRVGCVSKQWGKDWWWKQDGSSCELCSKDYVMEWIGSQICTSSSPEWDNEKSRLASEASLEKATIHMDASRTTVRCQSREFDCHQHRPIEGLKEKHTSVGQSRNTNEPKKMQEWWKEENLEEISSKKGRKKRSLESKLRKMSHKSAHFRLGQCFHMMKGGRCKERKRAYGVQGPEIGFTRGRKKKKAKTPSMSSEMWSGDLFSRELSSNTSMRGTLCYAAPEVGGCGFLMEKTDIYSLGVLILVIVSGRRPLNVLNSPMKLEKANLVSWCRQLAQSGDVLELIDERLKGLYKKEQATLCINLALACLQRMPELRPDIGDIVRILEGEMDLPQLPFEFSPSPPCKLSSRSRKKY